MAKKKRSRLDSLRIENEKLRRALADCLFPLHILSKYYGRPSLKTEAIDQAAKALRQAKEALQFDAEDLECFTNEYDPEMDHDDEDIQAWLSRFEEDEDDDDD